MREKSALQLFLSVLGVIGMVVVLSTSHPSQAETINICSNNCEYQSIQKAINASATGDTLYIRSGTYNENVKIDEGISLIGKGNVRLRGVRSGYPTMIAGPSNNELYIENFIVDETRGRECYDEEANLCPCGILIRGNVKANLEKVTVKGVHIGTPGIEVTDNSQVEIDDSKVSGNLYGLSIYDNSTVKLNDVVVRDNMAANISLGGSSSVRVSDSIVNGGMEGVIASGSSIVEIQGTKVSKSMVGILIGDHAHGTVRTSTVENGVTAGINFQSFAEGEVVDCNIRNNTAGVMVKGHSEVIINRTQIQNNMEGIVLLDMTKSSLRRSQIFNNTSGIIASKGFTGEISGWGNEIYGNNSNNLPHGKLAELT